MTGGRIEAGLNFAWPTHAQSLQTMGSKQQASLTGLRMPFGLALLEYYLRRLRRLDMIPISASGTGFNMVVYGRANLFYGYELSYISGATQDSTTGEQKRH